MYFTKFTEEPIKIYGLKVIDPENNIYQRLPDEKSALVSADVCGRARTCMGGRIRFRTDSKKLVVRASVYQNLPDKCIPITGSVGFDVFEGSLDNTRYLGCTAPENYDTCEFEYGFALSGDPEKNIMINLPRNMRVKNVEIGLDDGAHIYAPSEYTRSGKLCFYGSSITEGGCASRTGNSYAAILSRRLDIDYMNYGFSGSAKGELPMADIISEDDFRIIIMDYDFNAPNADFLRETHEPFFLRLREKKTNTPIVLMSRPSYDSNIPDSIARREVVRETFVNARARGDKNTYFIDGELMFGEVGRECCCVDEVHPTDLGHMRIAEYVYPTLKRLLDNGIK